jgi:hypothetical protein
MIVSIPFAFILFFILFSYDTLISLTTFRPILAYVPLPSSYLLPTFLSPRPSDNLGASPLDQKPLRGP